MAIYKNGEIYKGDQIEKVPDNSAASLITSDTKLNKSIEDYIILATKAQTLLEKIYEVASSYGIEDSGKLKAIKILANQDEES